MDLNFNTENLTGDSERLEGEEGLDLSKNSESVYPHAEVRVNKVQYSLLHLKRLVEERHELQIDPDFQRDDVWKQQQRIELVESILMGIPLPVIYLFESKDGTKQVVDGRQRITSIIDFLNDEFKLNNLKILPQFNKCSFSELPPKVSGIFEDFQISCYIIQPPTPERVKYDIFDRVNRGGTKLNSQEMRNALYRGHATKLIEDICKSNDFVTVTNHGVSAGRMRDKYAALRILAFYLLFSDQLGADENGQMIEYKSDIDDFLAKVMVKINESSTEEQRESWKCKILTAFREITATLGEDAFRFESTHNVRRPINMPLMEVLTFLFLSDWKRGDKRLIRQEVENVKLSFDASGQFRTRVDSSENVKERFATIKSTAKLLDALAE